MRVKNFSFLFLVKINDWSESHIDMWFASIAWETLSYRCFASKAIECVIMLQIRLNISVSWTYWAMEWCTNRSASIWEPIRCGKLLSGCHKWWTLLIILNVVWCISNHALVSHWVGVTCIIIGAIVQIETV